MKIAVQMKIAVVWSSPNVEGLTASAKNRFIDGLKKTGAEIDEVHLNKHYIEHCCDSMYNGALSGKNCFLIACAGGTGNGAVECLNDLERTTRHMGMAACDSTDR